MDFNNFEESAKEIILWRALVAPDSVKTNYNLTLQQNVPGEKIIATPKVSAQISLNAAHAEKYVTHALACTATIADAQRDCALIYGRQALLSQTKTDLGP